MPESTKSPAEVLEAAADLLEKPGAWTQGSFARTASGASESPFSPAASCFCLRGALCRVSNRRLHDLLEVETKALGFPTAAAMARWNDHPSRTQAEVVAALRQASIRGGEA